VRIKIWGTRGSIPSPEASHLGYGGNTCCIEVQTADDCIVLDGGIGLHWLGKELMRGAFGRGQGQGHVLLARSQWDHIQGIPFFIPLLIEGNRFTIYGSNSTSMPLSQALEAQMARAYCPVPNFLGPNIGAKVKIKGLETAGNIDLGTVRIRYHQVSGGPHRDGLGYRLEANGASMAYLPSIEYSDQSDRQIALDLAAGVDLLVHDSYYSPAEYKDNQGQGHASDADAVRIAQDAQARRLLLFHHHPDHDDAFIDARVASHGHCGLPVAGAREGEEFVLNAD
jgi:phosphoribosyl 1,2-cyclic phosphodiesterase